MTVLTGQITDDTKHEFSIMVDGKFIARVWHSDKGEWTVDTVDGPTFKAGNRDDAYNKAMRWYAAQNKEQS